MTPKEVAAKVRERFKNPHNWRSYSMGYVGGPVCLVGGVRVEVFGDTNSSRHWTGRSPEQLELYTRTLACITKASGATGMPTDMGYLEHHLTTLNDVHGYGRVMETLEKADEVCEG